MPGIGTTPGGPTASLVVTLQGDRLDPATAENPANYRVTWLGPDGQTIQAVSATGGTVHTALSIEGNGANYLFPSDRLLAVLAACCELTARVHFPSPLRPSFHCARVRVPVRASVHCPVV